MPRWIQAEKARYYQTVLVKDLFGEWILIVAMHCARSACKARKVKAWVGTPHRSMRYT